MLKWMQGFMLTGPSREAASPSRSPQDTEPRNELCSPATRRLSLRRKPTDLLARCDPAR
jgi:hypothetical protein